MSKKAIILCAVVVIVVVVAEFWAIYFTQNYTFSLNNNDQNDNYCCENGNTLVLDEYDKRVTCKTAFGMVYDMKFFCRSYDILRQNRDTFEVHATGGVRVNNHHTVKNGHFCIGNYTSGEIVVVCNDGNDLAAKFRKQHLVISLFDGVSAIFLWLTFYTYLALSVTNETQDLLLTVFIFCGAMKFTLRCIISQLSNVIVGLSSSLCAFTAYLHLFFSIAYWTLFFAAVCNLWKDSCLAHRNISKKVWCFALHCFLVIPILSVVQCCTGRGLETVISKSGFSYCWFEDINLEWNYMYYPAVHIFSIILVLIMWTTIVLWFYSASHNVAEERVPVLSERLRVHIILVFMLMILWYIHDLPIVNYRSESSSFSWIWLSIQNFSALHGVSVFILLVVAREDVFDKMQEKKICCC